MKGGFVAVRAAGKEIACRATGEVQRERPWAPTSLQWDDPAGGHLLGLS